jgi:hypothetical protein
MPTPIPQPSSQQTRVTTLTFSPSKSNTNKQQQHQQPTPHIAVNNVQNDVVMADNNRNPKKRPRPDGNAPSSPHKVPKYVRFGDDVYFTTGNFVSADVKISGRDCTKSR